MNGENGKLLGEKGSTGKLARTGDKSTLHNANSLFSRVICLQITDKLISKRVVDLVVREQLAASPE